MKRWKRFWHGLIIETLAAVGLLMVIGGVLDPDLLLSASSASHDTPRAGSRDNGEAQEATGSAALESRVDVKSSTSRPVVQWLSTVVHSN